MAATQKTLKAYLIGFILSLIFTLLAFAAVLYKALPSPLLAPALALLAFAQLLTQSRFFLGLNFREEGRFNLLPFLFTVLVIAILAGGSLWIMYNLNYNMQ